jgi:ubiquinone/menaquinone biosynthesis C-methylase UbiE
MKTASSGGSAASAVKPLKRHDRLSGIRAYLFDSPFEGKGMRSAFHWLCELEGLKVLDIGCGHGAVEIHAVSEGASASALNVNMERLRFAAEQSEGMGLPVSLVCGCSERLPFPDGVFDLVISRSTLQ